MRRGDPLSASAPPVAGTAENVAKVDAWRSGGVTLHRAHWATCPSAEQHRVNPAQEALL